MSKLRPEPENPLGNIPKWTRGYASNRSLGVALSIASLLLVFAGISWSSQIAGVAYRSGNGVLFWCSIGVLALSLVACVFFAVPRWGGELQSRLFDRLYSREGRVALAAPTGRRNRWALLLGIFLVFGVVATVILGFAYEIPSRYIQPISAIYFVPFLVGLWLLMRPTVGCAALFWPALYSLHAILILAGAPIVFSGAWESLNMLIPTFGYGILSALVGHAYSRIAWRRLKALTHVDLTNAEGREQ